MGRRFIDMRYINQRMQFKDDRINRLLAKQKEHDAMTDQVTLMEPAARTLTSAPAVTSDQLELVKRTIAKDATPEELQLFLYDCARQHVHPLDKLIHYTKRAGKYTPITSIDFMRIRAAESGECAGIDDATYTGTPATPTFEARVTVYRLVQGTRCPFSATARWTEYKPEQDFMWKKMPYVMLGKCAEALALRKGFPKQLSGLYVKEEMEQATPAPARGKAPAAIKPQEAPLGPADVSPGRVSLEAVGSDERAAANPGRGSAPANLNQAIPDAWVPFVKTTAITATIVDGKRSRSTGKTTLTLAGGQECWTTAHDVAAAAKVYNEAQTPITVTLTEGKEIVTLAEATNAAF
jgi:phage recombination protein Bet